MHKAALLSAGWPMSMSITMDLPSEDSEDSSYEPSDCEAGESSQKKRKRATSKRKRKQRRKTTSRSSLSAVTVQNCSPSWSTNIPNELLQLVFSYGVSTFGAAPFLCRCCLVCKKWNMVARSPVLWRSIDLSFMGNYSTAKDDVISSITARNLGSHIEHLNLSGWKKLTSSALEIIATSYTALKSLNLEQCEKLRARGVSFIAANCQNLTALNLSSISTDACSNMSLKNLLEQRGSQLNALHLAGNKSVGSSTLAFIQTWCGNLRILDLSNTSINHLNVERFQTACPKLIELRLGQLDLHTSTPNRNDIEYSGGFPDLELLSLASINGGVGTDDMLLRRLLKTSTKLRQIDLRGCERITSSGLLDLPITSLEQLFLSRCKLSWNALFSEIGKWKHSLRNLDVSWGHNLGDIVLFDLATAMKPNTVLTSLNLAGCGIGICVSAILESFPNLVELDLSSCRGVPRGFKKPHQKEGIERLRRVLHTE